MRSQFEDFGFIPDERSPQERTVDEFLRLGISPEALAELTVDQARFVLTGLAKSLATLTHPDRGEADSILGLDVGEINYLGHRIQTIEDEELSDLLAHLQEMPGNAIRAQRDASGLRESLGHSLDIGSRLAMEVLAGSEGIARTASISLLLPTSQGDVDVYRAIEGRVQIATVKDGVVVEAHEVEPVDGLVANFTEEQQDLFRSYRPQPNTTVVRAFIDEGQAKPLGLQSGWYLFKDAIGKQSKSRTLAVRMYLPHSDRSEEAPELVGSQLVGYYDYSASRAEGSTHRRMLPVEVEAEADIVNRELALALYAAGYTSDQEAAYLMARAHILPFTQAGELRNKEHFVFRRSDAAYAKRNIITPPILARHLI